jgi:nucleoside-diphosphate-sugar epimerase
MKRVIVTGATGCIGQKSIPYLIERGYTVHGITSKKFLPASGENLFWHQTDLLDAEQTRRLIEKVEPTHLLHLAWYFEKDVYSSAQNFLWVNASFALLENFIKNGGQRIVCAGTCAEYAWTRKIYREDETPLKPASVYGKCKLASQILFDAFTEREKVSAAWGRIFFMFGAGERENRLVPAVIRSLLKNELALCSHGNQIRDYLYVEDVADAFVNLLDGNVSGAVNIGSGNSTTLKEIIFKIAEITGNRELVKLGAIETSLNEPPQIVADVKRLKSEVGWSPKWSLEDGLRETVEWWRENI